MVNYHKVVAPSIKFYKHYSLNHFKGNEEKFSSVLKKMQENYKPITFDGNVPSLNFESRFESGNLMSVEQVS